VKVIEGNGMVLISTPAAMRDGADPAPENEITNR
jgi:hypothetical protein